MATCLTPNLHRHQWFSGSLLFLSLSSGLLLSFAAQRVTAQTVVQEVSPSAPSEAIFPSPSESTPAVLSQAIPDLPPARLSITPNSAVLQPQENPPFEGRDGRSSTAIVIPPRANQYKPTIPPLGESSYYLPNNADMSGLRLVVKLSKRRVYLYRLDKVIASYPIAVGKPGWETPVGTYQVFNMEKNPIFKSFKSGRIIKPGPENPLGVRWIGIWTDGKTQLGFHGTNEPELIGQAVSHGCIRMLNKDVTALFEQVEIGTPVRVER